MTTPARRTVLHGLLLVPALALAPTANANLLVDGGFEFNALNTVGNVFNDFANYQGVWGQEASTITGAVGGITPNSGAKMLAMTQNSGITTQIFQVVDVSTYASFIDSGNARAAVSAMLNVQGSGRIGGVFVSFYTAASYGSSIGGWPGASVNPLDSDISTWQMASAEVAIPVGTRWMMLQIAYNNASLSNPGGPAAIGYADDASLTIVPAPGVAGIVGALLFAGGRRRRT